MLAEMIYDLVVVGGGPSGATAAHDAAKAGLSVALLDRAGRIKPCGGAIPPRCIRDFDIPAGDAGGAHLLRPHHLAHRPQGRHAGHQFLCRHGRPRPLRRVAARARRARRVPNAAPAPMRASTRDGHGTADRPLQGEGRHARHAARPLRDRRRRRAVESRHATRCAAPRRCPMSSPITRSSSRPKRAPAHYETDRCDVYYRGTLSPDFYAWVFPHGKTTSVGTGSAHKGFSLKGAVADLREQMGLDRPDHPPRGRAHSAEAAEALGQWQGRGAGGRRRGRRGAGLGRGHLLRHARRQAGGGCRHRLPQDRATRASWPPRASAS